MLLNKNNVDKYAKETLPKLNTEKERNLRCYSIAERCYKVSDFESAIKYATIYLKEKPDSYSGHKILAECYEKQGDSLRALEYYQCALRYNTQQRGLVIKACELLCNTKVENVSREHIQFWVEEAQRYDLQHPAVLALKQRIITNTNIASDEEEIIQDVQGDNGSEYIQPSTSNNMPTSFAAQEDAGTKFSANRSAPEVMQEIEYTASSVLLKKLDRLEVLMTTVLTSLGSLQMDMNHIKLQYYQFQAQVQIPPQFNMFPLGYFLTYPPSNQNYPLPTGSTVCHPPSQAPQQDASIPVPLTMASSVPSPKLPLPIESTVCHPYPLPTGSTVCHPPSQAPQQGASIPVPLTMASSVPSPKLPLPVESTVCHPPSQAPQQDTSISIPPMARAVPSSKLQPAPPMSAPTVVVITSIDVLPTTTAAAVSQPTLSVTLPLQFCLGNVSATGKSPPASTSEISTYGGFTFTSAPVIKNIGEQKPKPAPPKPNPFASLQLVTSLEPHKPSSFSTMFSSPVTKTVTVTSACSASSADTGIAFKSGTVDFATLSNQEAISPTFSGKTGAKSFEGAGPVFGSPKDTGVSEPSTSHGDDFVPTAEFEPVITLPDSVEIVTGEEGSEVLYEERCKLLRFADKEWKERGVGNMKILYDEQNRRVRLVMRREQVHKVCCNQYLTRNHELKALATTDKAWSWYAKDYSEGELRDELLAVRFKTAEQAKEFKEAFDDAKLLIDVKKGESGDSTKLEKWACVGCSKEYAISEKKCLSCGFLRDVEIETVDETSQKQSDGEAPGVSQQRVTKPADSSFCTQNKTRLSEMFKSKEGSWECKTCYLQNALSALKCIGCNSKKENITQKTVLSSPQASVISSHSKPFGGFAAPLKTADSSKAKMSLSAMFKPKEGSWECKTCYVRNELSALKCVSCNTKKEGITQIPPSAFSFAPSCSNVFTFGASAATRITPSSSSATSVTTGTKDSKPFTLSPTATPSFDKPRNAEGEAESTNDSADNIYVEGVDKPETQFESSKRDEKDKGSMFHLKEAMVKFHDHPHFEPVVPLPDEIVVRTGEEEEQIVFNRKGKIFRYSEKTKEWKERGVGEVKVLHDPVRGTYRLLCRREQVQKVVLNQRLISSFTLQRMKNCNKSWCWTGMNMPEEFTVPQMEKLAARFTTPEVAIQFRDVILRAVSTLDPLQGEAVF